MTSKKSYSKLLKIIMKNHMWSIALTCIGLFFVMPIYAALQATIINNNFITGMYKAEFLTRIFARAVLGEGNFLLSLATIVLAVVIALNGFSYLFSKDKVDLYHSLPVKRGELFFITYIAGVITFLVPYIIFMILMLIVSQAVGMLNGVGIISTMIMLFINFLGFLGVYSIVVLAIMLTGNMVVSIMASATFLLYMPAISLLVRFLRGLFFITYTGEDSVAPDLIMRISPAFEYVGLTEGMNSFWGTYSLNALKIIIYVIYIIAMTAIDYYIYMNRASEAAGKSIAFKRSMPIISIALLTPAAVYSALAFTGIASNGGISNGWLIFGAIFALFIGHLIIQAIYYRDFKSLFKNFVNPIIAGVIVAVILLVYKFDMTGFDSYCPGEDKLDSIAIASYGLYGDQEYYDFDVDENEYGDKYYWVDQRYYRFQNMKIKDYDLIREFVSAALKNSREIKEEQSADDFSYDGKAYTAITVRFNLKNGKVHYRDYTIELKSHMDLYNKLYTNEDYKKGVFDIFNLDDDKIENIKVADAIGDVSDTLSKEQMIALVNTYREELLNQDAYELRDGNPVAYLYKDCIIKENGYTNRFFVDKSYIYPSFTKTLGLIEEYGIDINKYSNADNVEFIEIANYHYNEENPSLNEAVEEMAMEDVYPYEENVDRKKYTDAEDIRKIFEVAVPSSFVDSNYPIKDMAQIDVNIQFKDTPDAYSNYIVYYYIPKGMLPDFVEQDVKYVE